MHTQWSTQLEEMREAFYETKVKVSKEEAIVLLKRIPENNTQVANSTGKGEKVRVTAKITTKVNKKVEAILYSTFKGNRKLKSMA